MRDPAIRCTGLAVDATDRPQPEPATAQWEALGTTALVRVDDPMQLAAARAVVVAELERIDRAASRFRSDSELMAVNAGAGRFTRLGEALHEAVAVALRAAAITGGAVDPTLGRALRLAGYERDYADLEHPDGAEPAGADPAGADPPALSVVRVGGWEEITLVDDPPGVLIPAGMQLDLGATAKALAADRSAARAAAATGTGVLVALGGDIAVAGRVPAGRWPIRVTDDHRSAPDVFGQTITIGSGGLATSSTVTRRWRHHGRVTHHILDPATGAPARSPWRTVSVTAASCVDANTASTAAIVIGPGAIAWLSERHLAARLVDDAGRVTRVGGWPPDGPAT
jgi:thiamine biosynthesis lipoprotein